MFLLINYLRVKYCCHRVYYGNTKLHKVLPCIYVLRFSEHATNVSRSHCMAESLYTPHTHTISMSWHSEDIAQPSAVCIVFHCANTTEIYACNNNFSLNNTSHTYRKGLSTTYKIIIKKFSN